MSSRHISASSRYYWVFALALLVVPPLNAQVTKKKIVDKFAQLDLRDSSAQRTAGGSPGHRYWQQQVDYHIDTTLDEDKQHISAKMRITYHNNSPDSLRYLWLHLEQNRFTEDSAANTTLEFGGRGSRSPVTRNAKGDRPAGIHLRGLRRMQSQADNQYGFVVSDVRGGQSGRALKFSVYGAQLRIDLPRPIKAGEAYTFTLDYNFNIIEENSVGGRSGYEHFPDDARKGGNHIFLLAQWYPRVAAYSDYEAWHNKEFLGRGEFTTEFGDYKVSMTVPADHIVASTGVLQNPHEVLTAVQQERLQQARNATKPVMVVTADEALANEAEGTKETRTWHFVAKNVRDFAWGSSRKFMWDAQGYHQKGDVQPFVWAMSYFPKEGGDLWKKYSTAAVIHAMEVYSRFTFDYPYPVSISVNGPVGGMEYPMITFNGPRTTWHEEDERSYPLSEKRFLIGVVIHEVGHNYFPMIVNSDERQWTWMDEGINSYLDGVAGREWDPDIPWRVEPRDIVGYMKSSEQVPIMTQSDSILQFGPNAYTKPAVAFNILREVILGRDRFDFALREYSNLWRNKRPTPADFFRVMEEASGVDLDWFFRGWFYTTDHVDIGIDSVERLRLDTMDPDIDFDRRRDEEAEKPGSLFVERNREEGRKLWIERNPDVTDFYDKHDRFTVTNKDRNAYSKKVAEFDEWERVALKRALKEDANYYLVTFSNRGGLVMPILLTIEYERGKPETMYIPAEIWRRNTEKVTKLIVTDRKRVIKSITVDENWETADVDVSNNHYPRRIEQSRIEAYKSKKRKDFVYRDVMHDSKSELKPTEPKKKQK